MTFLCDLLFDAVVNDLMSAAIVITVFTDSPLWQTLLLLVAVVSVVVNAAHYIQKRKKHAVRLFYIEGLSRRSRYALIIVTGALLVAAATTLVMRNFIVVPFVYIYCIYTSMLAVAIRSKACAQQMLHE